MTTNVTDDLGLQQGDLLPPEDDVEVTASEYTVLPTGDYRVELWGVKREEPSIYGPVVKLIYQVVDGEHAGAQVDELCSVKGGLGAKLARRLTALRGRAYNPGETIRPRDCIGRLGVATVVVKQAKSQEGQVFDVNRVTDVRPAYPPPARPVRRQAGPEEQPPESAWETATPPPDEGEDAA